MPAGIATYLLTTGQSADAIAAQVQRTRATAVQILHPISPVESERLAAALPHIHRVQVVHVEGPDANGIPSHAAHVNAFLLDSGRPGAARPELGGTGRIHDWTISAAFVRQSPKPTFLAGGLCADNAGAAIRQVRPFGLDLCSAIRTDGHLDARKLTAFMTAVRQADEEARYDDPSVSAQPCRPCVTAHPIPLAPPPRSMVYMPDERTREMPKDLRAGPAEGRYDYPVEGGNAFADYIRQGDILRVTYTQVPDALRGRGVGAALVKALLDEVRAQNMKVVPQCSFVAAYIRRHPAMRDLLADEAAS